MYEEIKRLKQIRKLACWLIFSIGITAISVVICINLYKENANTKKQIKILKAADVQQQNINNEMKKFIETVFSINSATYKNNIKQLKVASSQQVYEQLLAEDCSPDSKTECVSAPIYIQKIGNDVYSVLSQITTHTTVDNDDLGRSSEIWQFTIKYIENSKNKKWNIKVEEMYPANINPDIQQN